jgi:hypothetical protein
MSTGPPEKGKSIRHIAPFSLGSSRRRHSSCFRSEHDSDIECKDDFLFSAGYIGPIGSQVVYRRTQGNNAPQTASARIFEYVLA